MRYFFNLRLFWVCRVTEGGDGYYYHTWTNYFLAESHNIFAGYTRHVLNSKDTSFKTVQEKLKL